MFFKTTQEVMNLPEIEIKEERGSTLLSILLKGYNPEWGGHEHELSKEVETFFEQNPLDKKSVNSLNEINALKEEGTDAEVLYNIALTYNHPERIDNLIDFIAKHKDYITDPQDLREQIVSMLNKIESLLPESLKNKMDQATIDDIEKRNQFIIQTKIRFKNLIDFFKPSEQTTSIKKITLLPTDFLYSKESGSAFEFGDEMILRSHIDNPVNLDHEFLHSIINPIIDKLSSKLTVDQKQKISEAGSYRLKVEEKYGESFYVLLCEEFIRTYTDIVQKNKKPITYIDFVTERIDKINDNQFVELLQRNKVFRDRCHQLGITKLKEFKGQSQEYYDKFESNKLREIIFEFYQKCIKEKEKNDKITFEDSILRDFRTML